MQQPGIRPPPPVKPVEKLPFTYHLTLVPEPQKGERGLTLVATKMQGGEIRARKVLTSFDDRQEAMDELNRIATRLFYFDAPEEVFGDE